MRTTFTHLILPALCAVAAIGTIELAIELRYHPGFWQKTPWLLHDPYRGEQFDRVEMYERHGSLTLFHIYGRGVLWLGAITVISDYLVYRKDGEFSDLFKTVNLYLCAAFAVACYLGITILGKREGAQFVYFQF